MNIKKRMRTRIYIMIGVFALVFCILIYRLYTLQIRDASYWNERADRQYILTKTDIFSRGTLYGTLRDGTALPIASMTSGYILAVDFGTLDLPQEVFAQLQLILPELERETFMAYAYEKYGYRELDHMVSEEDAERIRNLNIDGVYTVRTQWRTYPYDSLMARAIGIVGKSTDDDTIRGRYGLERAYEENLARPTEKKTVNFFAELFSDIKNVVTTTGDTAKEGSVVTTLEPVVSSMLMDTLRMVHETYEGELTGGIIMNPQTGEVYAMEALPTFNLNDRTDVPAKYFVNPNTMYQFEFGSIVKPLTVAMGIDTGVIGRYTTYNDTGCLTLNRSTVCNWDGRARGETTVQEILSQSLNVGVAHITIDLLGHDRFRSYIENLHIGDETGIDAGGEVVGNIKNLSTKRDIEYATASYGQGISMTPIEMIRALGTLANKGQLVSPRIGDTILLESGKTIPVVFPPGEQVFKETTAETVTRMLVAVVDDALAYGTLKKDGYSIAAKTGTAFLTSDTGGYDTERFFHSFYGYFPAYNPKFVVLLYTKDPKHAVYASQTLAQGFMDLAGKLINYYEIPPDR